VIPCFVKHQQKSNSDWYGRAGRGSKQGDSEHRRLQVDGIEKSMSSWLGRLASCGVRENVRKIRSCSLASNAATGRLPFPRWLSVSILTSLVSIGCIGVLGSCALDWVLTANRRQLVCIRPVENMLSISETRPVLYYGFVCLLGDKADPEDEQAALCSCAAFCLSSRV